MAISSFKRSRASLIKVELSNKLLSRRSSRSSRATTTPPRYRGAVPLFVDPALALVELSLLLFSSSFLKLFYLGLLSLAIIFSRIYTRY